MAHHWRQRRRPAATAFTATHLHRTLRRRRLVQVIAATTWDVHRNIQLNDRPVTPQQQAALQEWLEQWQQGGRRSR